MRAKKGYNNFLSKQGYKKIKIFFVVRAKNRGLHYKYFSAKRGTIKLRLSLHCSRKKRVTTRSFRSKASTSCPRAAASCLASTTVWENGSFAQGLPITSHTLDHTNICASEAKLVKRNQWERPGHRKAISMGLVIQRLCGRRP